MKWLISFLFIVSLSLSAHSQQWYPLGPDVNNQPALGTVEFFDMALAPDGSKYIAFKDNANDGKATVRRYNSTNWESVGSTGISADEIDNIRITISDAGTPYLVFDQPSNLGYLRVKKYTGTNWVNVGGTINSGNTGVGGNLNIHVDTAGYIYVAYLDGNSQVRVMKYMNNSWTLIGGAVVEPYASSYLDMVIGPDSRPYIAYNMPGTSQQLPGPVVRTWNDTAWVAIGDPIDPNYVDNVQLEIDKQGNPVVAYAYPYVYPNLPLPLRVKKYNGTAWVDQGSLPAVNNLSGMRLTLDTAGNPIVTYKYTTAASDTAIMLQYDGTAWQMLHQAYALDFRFPIIKVDSSNTLYACFFENWIRPKLKAWTTNGITDMSGDTGIPGMAEFIGDIAADSAGHLYIASLIGADQLGIWYYDGYSWGLLDTTNGPVIGSNFGSMLIDKAGVLHVSYNDSAANNKVTVKKYTGSGWATVGPAGFSPGTYPGYLQFDTANVPYIAYGHYFNSGNIIVKKYDGSTWVDVGLNGQVATGCLNKNSFVIDKNNNLYVANSLAISQPSPISKYDGNTWNYVGTNAGIGAIFRPAIAVDTSGIVHFFYSEYNQGLKYQTYDGVNWSVPDTLSSQGAQDACTGFLNGNTLTLAYTDANKPCSHVKKYTGSTWIDIAPATYGGDGVQHTLMNVAGNKIYAVTTNFVGSFARVYTAPAPTCTTNTWTGFAGNGLWATVGNWSCGVVPAQNQDVVIPAGAAIVIDNAAECNNLTVSAGASLSFLGNNPMLHVFGTMNNNGTFNTAGGTLQVDN